MVRRLAWLLLGILAIVAAGAWWVHSRVATPYRAFQDEVFVELPSGTSEVNIAQRLADAGVVPDAWTFRLAARLAHADRKLQAGEYRFAEAASPADVVARLARGDVFARGITFPEGLSYREMAPLFERSGLGSAADFARAAEDGALAAAFDPDAPTLEGYLFPSTYAMGRNTGAAATVKAMVGQFERVFDSGLRAAAAAQHMSVRDAVTLASIVEKETAQPAERPIVAAVYRNRLAIGMPLQCDPTVVYAMMEAGRWKGNIQKADLAIDSPYNTYRFPGLPPGPIANPGRASLEAAVHPAEVKYLYFVSRNDGSHVFSSTLAEHNQNVARWQKKYVGRD
jgi:UPF0755 protein